MYNIVLWQGRIVEILESAAQKLWKHVLKHLQFAKEARNCDPRQIATLSASIEAFPHVGGHPQGLCLFLFQWHSSGTVSQLRCGTLYVALLLVVPFVPISPSFSIPFHSPNFPSISPHFATMSPFAPFFSLPLHFPAVPSISPHFGTMSPFLPFFRALAASGLIRLWLVRMLGGRREHHNRPAAAFGSPNKKKPPCWATTD